MNTKLKALSLLTLLPAALMLGGCGSNSAGPYGEHTATWFEQPAHMDQLKAQALWCEGRYYKDGLSQAQIKTLHGCAVLNTVMPAIPQPERLSIDYAAMREYGKYMNADGSRKQ